MSGSTFRCPAHLTLKTATEVILRANVKFTNFQIQRMKKLVILTLIFFATCFTGFADIKTSDFPFNSGNSYGMPASTSAYPSLDNAVDGGEYNLNEYLKIITLQNSGLLTGSNQGLCLRQGKNPVETGTIELQAADGCTISEVTFEVNTSFGVAAKYLRYLRDGADPSKVVSWAIIDSSAKGSATKKLDDVASVRFNNLNTNGPILIRSIRVTMDISPGGEKQTVTLSWNWNPADYTIEDGKVVISGGKSLKVPAVTVTGADGNVVQNPKLNFTTGSGLVYADGNIKAEKVDENTPGWLKVSFAGNNRYEATPEGDELEQQFNITPADRTTTLSWNWNPADYTIEDGKVVISGGKSLKVPAVTVKDADGNVVQNPKLNFTTSTGLVYENGYIKAEKVDENTTGWLKVSFAGNSDYDATPEGAELQQQFKIMSSVSSIDTPAIDPSESEKNAVYYDTNGNRVKSADRNKGVLIRVCGGKALKVIK